jgi:hypothetical protein
MSITAKSRGRRADKQMRISGKHTAVLFVFMVVLDVVARLSPHAPDFMPLAATALFASFLFPSRALAGLVPISALAISDCFIGAYDWRIMMVVYASLAFPVLLRRFLGEQVSPARVIVSSLTSSIVFFTASNFAVWAFSGMYSRDRLGLFQCYVSAIPFFQNTLTGDLFWSGILFGGYWLVAKNRRARLALAGPVS